MAAKKAKKNDEEIETEPVVTEPNPEEEEIVIDVPEEAEPTVDDLPGVGPATAEKLREAGYDDLLSIAVMTPVELAD